jgi:hypothetical protein
MVEDTPVTAGVASWPDPGSVARAVRRMQLKFGFRPNRRAQDAIAEIAHTSATDRPGVK